MVIIRKTGDGDFFACQFFSIIREKYKPIYYALMYFMRDQYPDEYKKMGPELKQTVEEIIETVNQWAIDYK
ncbi:MAG: hypothetical protein GTN82_41575 [Candidatus Aminicenantes bacterium]|nr:hypothetical protein [Candidatus Aminicenantes bacterium]NIN48056.1 hypothetical protein [Candidatus Aminicenantes bacterium]NIR11937.1 hypothetical protein [Candidatus Aminicenantes bacterium]